MKLNKEKQINFDSTMTLEGYDAKISQDDLHKLWDLLQNPYKNPIGAVVREYVSNSFDAHAEADFIKNNDISSIRNEYSIYNDMSDEDVIKLKKHLKVFNNDAVHVKIAKDTGGWFWSTEDFGVGLSPSRVKDVFCSYLKSTKEETDNVIGAFGIGSKSGLAYTDIVYIRTRYNGIEYGYFLRKGEKQPRLDKVSECATTERNGTQIKLYLKSERDRYDDLVLDTHRFKEECKKQLAYFDNVYFDGCGIENDYVVIRGDNWLKNNMASPYDGMHMCLGKVAYPIDWDNLGGQTKIPLDVALKFEIGELDIIQTREDVKYTPRTKKAIIDKIEAVREEFNERWEKENDLKTDDLLYYMKNYDNDPVLKYQGDIKINLGYLYPDSSGYSSSDNFRDHVPWFTFTPFEEEGIKLPPDPFFDYKCEKFISPNGLRQQNTGVTWLLKDKEDRQEKVYYRIKDNHDSRKNKYIRNKLESSDVYLIRKKSQYFYKLSNYVKYCGLKWDDRANWRRKIKLYQDTIMKSFIATTKSYDRVLVDKQWIKDHYGVKKKLDRSIIVAKKLLEYYQAGESYSYHRRELIRGNLGNLKHDLKIVGTHEERGQLKAISCLYAQQTKLKIPRRATDEKGCVLTYIVAPTNVKYFKNLNNVVTMESFMSEHDKVFRRAMTCKRIMKDKKYHKVYQFIVNTKFNDWSNIYQKIADDFEYINNYVTTNNCSRNLNWEGNKFIDEVCYPLAEEKDWFDYDFFKRVDEVMEYFDGLDMLYILNYSQLRKENFPTLAIAKYIRDYNRSSRNIKRFKRLNPYYYVMFNEQELEWLKANEKEYEFVMKDKPNVELKKVS